MANVPILTKDMYEMPQRTPMKHGPLDPRLGTSQKSQNCDTCGLRMAECAGHFGYVTLELPVFHIGFFSATRTILQRICKTCSRVLLSDDDIHVYTRKMRIKDADGQQRKAINKLINDKVKKVSECPRCYASNGPVKKVGPLKLVHEKFKPAHMESDRFYQDFEMADSQFKDLKKMAEKAHDDLTPLKALELLRRIPDSDCEVLDLDPIHGRPEKLLLTHLLVPPVCIRPSVAMDGSGGSNEDDITILLSEIIFINTVIKKHFESGGNVEMIMEDWEFLQLKTALYINSEMTGIPAAMAPKKALRGFCQRLKGKTGRFRGNLSGKRVDFSSRTVISPDPNLHIDQVGVPRFVAKILTYPQRVFDHNLEFMRELVMNGPDVHPGANFVEYASAMKRFLRYGNRQQIARDLRVGDIVERHLIDGDVVLFNRQPSLHKMSIMCHHVKVCPWRTFRFNESVCTPYNADFDGDEMNLHVPQTDEARAEAHILMNTINNICTPRNGEPLISATQDFITGIYLLTLKDTFLTRQEMCQLASVLSEGRNKIKLPPPAIMKPVCLWTGKQLTGIILRDSVHSKTIINLETEGRNYLPKTKVVPGPALVMCPEDSYIVIKNSIHMCGQLEKGTVGSGSKDTIFYAILRTCGERESADCMRRLSKVTSFFIQNKGFSIGIYDVWPSRTLLEFKEELMNTGYRKCDEYISDLKANRLTTQAGMTPDQTLEVIINGELSRIREDAGKKCLLELPRSNAPWIMARCGSKGSKINMSQMIACVGQQSINGARIPDGFEERSLPHFPRRSKIPKAKGFVSNSFFTGLTATEFFFHTQGGREGLVDTAVKTAETGYMQRRLMKALEDLSTQYDLTVRNSVGVMIQFRYGDDGLDPAYMEGQGKPVALQRLYAHTLNTNPFLDEEALSDIEMLDETEELLASHAIFNPLRDIAKSQENAEHFFMKDLRDFMNEQATLWRRTCTLYPDESNGGINLKTVNKVRRLTRSQLFYFFNACVDKYLKTTIEPGTAVGAVAAQSLGEPCTQMTLKTFHFAGVAAMNVTLGVPRIKEIINASKAISTPVITAELDIGNSLPGARVVKGRIESTFLGQIAEYFEQIITPHDSYVVVKLDLARIRALMLELNMGIIIDAIRSAPRMKFKDVSPYGVDQIRVTPQISSKSGVYFSLQTVQSQLPKVVVKGIRTISRAVVTQDKTKYQLIVEGTDLLRVMTTRGVDGTHTSSNHILEVEKTLGIEAARSAVMSEVNYVMDKYGLVIDPRHLMLLADLMAFKGEVLGITRFGIAKMKESVFMLASFEKTTDHLFEAAIHGTKDSMDGVSECIIMGMPMNIGTGLFKLLHRSSNPKPAPKRPLLFDVDGFHLPLAKLTAAGGKGK